MNAEVVFRGRVEFPWASENDTVIQRTDGSCLYSLASVVDDFEIAGAVCPTAGDTYDLTIEVNDGALYDFAFLTLTIFGCP